MDWFRFFRKKGSILSRRIKIVLTREYLDDNKPVRFNYENFNLLAVEQDWDYDGISLFLIHKEFPKKEEGCRCPEYFMDEAKYRFPYLFEDTNPILFRKYS